MQTCSKCSYNNRPGVLFCENCGNSLSGEAAVAPTRAINDIGMPRSSSFSSIGNDYFIPGSKLGLEIEQGADPVIIEPKQEVIFGRRDPATGSMPDIDLTPYGGYTKGVSRRHAAIRSTEDDHLDIWDLGSSNGTFQNGQRLHAHRPYRLRDGDRLRLGQVVVLVTFHLPEDADSTLSTAELEREAGKYIPPAPKTKPRPIAVPEDSEELPNAPTTRNIVENELVEGQPLGEGRVAGEEKSEPQTPSASIVEPAVEEFSALEEHDPPTLPEKPASE